MKQFFYIIVSLLFLTSCDDWFDVKSSSEIRRDEHYKNVRGFQQTLTGCYIKMSEVGLYGKSMSFYAPEVMAHQFEKLSDLSLAALHEHNYRTVETILLFDQVWANAYNVIVNANDALEKIEEKKKELNPIDYAVLRGEFLAIRAYIHFDLLRLYGYGDWANRKSQLDAKLTIPYVTGLSKYLTPQHTGAEVYNFLIKDLDEAAVLLKENDPITKVKKASDFEIVNSDGFYRYRNLHLNYYAVRGLQARIHQWMGSPEAMTKALDAATEVIKFVEAGGFISSSDAFSTTVDFIASDKLNESNYCLFPEALFGLEVQDLESKTKMFFVRDFVSGNTTALHINSTRTAEIYESQNLDVRFSKLLYQNTGANNSYVSVKLFQDKLATNNKNRVALLRIPEVYYIAAEAQLAQGASGVTEAINLLNKVRTKRGLFTPLSTTLSVQATMDEIRKEYAKEFVSEGVMFFYYKRLGIKHFYGTPVGEEMTDKQYVVPFPDFELQSGRVQ